MGLDTWKTAFEAWCEVTRVGERPFEGSIYTQAGEAIEPKLIEWCKTEVSPYVYTPEEFYNVANAKQALRYDFFPHEVIFGGMWDAIILDGPLGEGKPIGVIEAKTSKRVQDWVDGVPPKYAVQGLLYAHLLGVEHVYFPVRFMDEAAGEYKHPERCECVGDGDGANTMLYALKVSESDIADVVAYAEAWHAKHVEGNVSPPFDEKADKAILKIIRKSEVTSDSLEALAKKARLIEERIAVIREHNDLDELEKALKKLKGEIKPEIIKRFGATDTEVHAHGWYVKKSEETSIDKEKLEQDGLLAQYEVVKDKYTLRKEGKSDG